MADTAAQDRGSNLRQDEAFLRRAFHRALLPCVLSILSENINILVDGILVGQRIGTDGLSAISLCVPVYLVLCVAGSFLASGTAIQAAKAIGRQQQERSQRLYHTAVWACLAVSSLMTAAGLALGGPLSALLCADPAIRPLVREYTTITLLGALRADKAGGPDDAGDGGRERSAGPALPLSPGHGDRRSCLGQRHRHGGGLCHGLLLAVRPGQQLPSGGGPGSPPGRTGGRSPRQGARPR